MMINTPEDIRNYGLIVLKYRLRMESLGMKSRGPSAFSQVKKLMNLKIKDAKTALPLYEAWLIQAVPGYTPK
jgi:hypothetical protein